MQFTLAIPILMDANETRRRIAICPHNEGCPASLEPRKAYRIIPDPVAEEIGHIRVIDESGEDYIYPLTMFYEAGVPPLSRE